jgi:hypothetical protein
MVDFFPSIIGFYVGRVQPILIRYAGRLDTKYRVPHFGIQVPLFMSKECESGNGIRI